MTRKTDFSPWRQHAGIDGYGSADAIASIEATATDAIQQASAIHSSPGGSAAADSVKSLSDSLVNTDQADTAGFSQWTTDHSSDGLHGFNASGMGSSEDAGAAPALSNLDAASTVTVADGASVEITGAGTPSITFTGTTGTLQIDHSLTFAGQISGLKGSDALDLADMKYGASTTATFSGNANGGTLTITDGAHTAHMSLQGDYLNSGWTLSSDGHGGTLVVDPPLAATILPGFPDASTTGVPAGVTLTPHNGDIYLTTPGEQLSGLDITGTVYVEAPGCTITNCKIDAKGGYFCIDASASNSAGLTVSDCTLLNSAGGNVNGSNIECNGATITGNDMSGFSHCIASDGGNLIQNNYMHDLNGTTSGHYECIYIGGGAAGDTINHNTMISFDTADVFMKTDYGPVTNEVIENNLMLQQTPVPVAGLHTTSYNIYLYNTGDGVSGNVVTNNILQQGYYGYTDVNDPSVVWTGNTDYSTGQTISVNGTLSSAPAGPSAPVIKSFSPDTGVVGDGITSANTLDLKGTADANSTITVYDGSTKLGTTTASSTGSWDYITSVLTNAKHVLTATETNSSGQTSAASAALTVTVDTHVPAAPVLLGDAVVNTNHVQVSGTAEANSTITVYDGTTVVGTGTTSSTGTWSVTTSALSSGTQVLTATATDAAGKVSAASQPLDPVIPAATPTPPAAPTIVSFSPDTGVVGDHITNDSTPMLTGTAVANSTVKIFDGTTQIGSTTANGSGQWSLTTPTLSNGTHSLTATDTLSGQTSTASAAFSVTIDTHVPAAPVLLSDAVVNTNHVQLSGTAEANSTITVYDGTTVVGTGTTSSTGSWSVTTSALSSGTQVLTATATDAAGTVSAVSQPLDPLIPVSTPTPPSAPTIASFSPDTGVAGDHITNDNTPTLTGTAVANSTVDVFDGKALVGTAAVDASGHWSVTTSALSDGTHNLTATDISSGHTSAASTAFSVTIDTHVPVAPTLGVYSQSGSAVGSTTTLTDVVLKGSAEAGSTIDIFDSGKQIGTVTTSSGSWSFDTGSLANGSHSFTATAIDAAGTSSHASVADVVSVTSSTPTPPTAPKSIDFTDVSYSTSNDTATIRGTADAYSQVKLYDGTTLLGTVTASSKGTWSLTDSNMSDTLHTITAQEVNSSGHVVATSSGSAMLMASNTSTLTGTGGDDYMYSSSSQVNDTFVFASNFGHSTISGFTATGPGHDTVQFSKSVFDSFASVLSHASQVGQDVVISSGHETLTLTNTKLGALNSQDFHFA